MRSVVVAVVALGGCFAPHPQAGSPCATAPCPSGLVCSPRTLRCELEAAPGIDAAPVAIALVQQVTAHVETGDGVSATLAQLPANGDTLVMVGGNVHNQLASVTGGGATWTRAVNSNVWQNIEVWYGTSDGTSATVTIALPGANAASSLWLGEWSGLATPTAVRAALATDGTSSPASAGQVGADAGALALFAVADISPNTFGAPSPGTWTALEPIVSTSTSQAVWYEALDAPATLAPAVSETANQWDAALVVFAR